VAGSVGAGLFVPDPNAVGVYGRGVVVDERLTGLRAAIGGLDQSSARGDALCTRHQPCHVERCGYLHSFPQLLGTVHSFTGGERAHALLVQAVEDGADWGGHQTLTDLVLTPAACYAIYPHMTGVLPIHGRILDVESWCFRQEPTHLPERMRAFRMREFVRLGAPDVVQRWRVDWLGRAERFLDSLGLQASIEPANDPFFGAGARFLRASQLDQELKFELVAPVSPDAQVAIMSCNNHVDHFGNAFGIRLLDGDVAHTACVGFGLERMLLALSQPMARCWTTGRTRCAVYCFRRDAGVGRAAERLGAG
jgi:seryl-tRNA synthetase